jgi:N-acetylmuramoyl-L-alanine amidase
MDNKEDCELLLSPKGKLAIADIHVKGILKYVDKS